MQNAQNARCAGPLKHSLVQTPGNTQTPRHPITAAVYGALQSACVTLPTSGLTEPCSHAARHDHRHPFPLLTPACPHPGPTASPTSSTTRASAPYSRPSCSPRPASSRAASRWRSRCPPPPGPRQAAGVCRYSCPALKTVAVSGGGHTAGRARGRAVSSQEGHMLVLARLLWTRRWLSTPAQPAADVWCCSVPAGPDRGGRLLLRRRQAARPVAGQLTVHGQCGLDRLPCAAEPLRSARPRLTTHSALFRLSLAPLQALPS